MLFFQYLSLSASVFSVTILGCLSVVPRVEPVDISNPPERDAVCAAETVPVKEITAALKHAHGWVQTGKKGGN